MPYVDLPGEVQLFYEIHTPSGSPDYNKPSLLMLVPSFLTVTFLEPYVKAFRDEYSITTLVPRSHGRSRNPVDLDQKKGSYDFWVGAADVAVAMEALRIPPSHILAPGCMGFQSAYLLCCPSFPSPLFPVCPFLYIETDFHSPPYLSSTVPRPRLLPSLLSAALKLAILFPDQVLSLCLVGASTLFAAPNNLEAFLEIDEGWVRPDNIEHYVDVLGGIGDFVLGDKIYPGWEDVWDRVVPHFARRYSPFRARDIWMTSEPNHRVRSPPFPSPSVTRLTSSPHRIPDLHPPSSERLNILSSSFKATTTTASE
jgi:hypothetical protein